MTDEKQVFEQFRFDYSEKELLAMGHELAQENRGIYDLEKEKKELMADLSAKIKAANGRAESMTNRINNGYEMRDVQVIFAMDTPEEGMKTVLRVDRIGEPVRVEPMTPDERQRELFPQ